MWVLTNRNLTGISMLAVNIETGAELKVQQSGKGAIIFQTQDYVKEHSSHMVGEFGSIEDAEIILTKILVQLGAIDVTTGEPILDPTRGGHIHLAAKR